MTQNTEPQNENFNTRNKDFNTVLGDMVALLQKSEQHRYMFMADLEFLIYPAIVTNSYQIFHSGGKAQGFALWAKVNDTAHKRMMDGIIRLQPTDWESGENIWLIDIVGSNGVEDDILHALVNQTFSETSFMMQNYNVRGEYVPEKIFGANYNPETDKNSIEN